jgi:hypothetical protein
VFSWITDGLVLLQSSQQSSSKLDIAKLTFLMPLVAPQEVVVLVVTF